MTTTTTVLEKMQEKYKPTTHTGKSTAQVNINRTADSDLERAVSNSPILNADSDLGAKFRQGKEIEIALRKLANQYGQLNVGLQDILSLKNEVNLSMGDRVEMLKSYLPIIGKGEEAREDILLDATEKKGSRICYLVDQVANVADELHGKAIEGKQSAVETKQFAIAQMKRLDQKIISCLQSTYDANADQTGVQGAIEQLTKDLNDIDTELESYEIKVQNAKTERDYDQVTELTHEMNELLAFKYDILDNKLEAEGTDSEIRRALMDNSEGLQSAKGAIMAQRANYQAASLIEDAMSELEIKYRHAKEDMVPVFRTQAQILAAGQATEELYGALSQMANISVRLGELNVEIAEGVSARAFKMLQEPVYDPKAMYESEQRLATFRKDLNVLKDQWASEQQVVRGAGSSGHFGYDVEK